MPNLQLCTPTHSARLAQRCSRGADCCTAGRARRRVALGPHRCRGTGERWRQIGHNSASARSVDSTIPGAWADGLRRAIEFNRLNLRVEAQLRPRRRQPWPSALRAHLGLHYSAISAPLRQTGSRWGWPRKPRRSGPVQSIELPAPRVPTAPTLNEPGALRAGTFINTTPAKPASTGTANALAARAGRFRGAESRPCGRHRSRPT